MTKLGDFTRPVMSSSAGFHADQARRNLPKEVDDLLAPQLPADDDLTRTIHAVHLEHVLGEINADGANLHMDAPSGDSLFNDHPFGTRCRERASSTTSFVLRDQWRCMNRQTSWRNDVWPAALRGQEHSLRICLTLEAHDEVIAHNHNVTMWIATMPLVDPEIEDVVQEDVGEERADARPLRCASVGLLQLAALKNAGSQPQSDERQNAKIGDSVRHHPQQPLVVDRVEEAANVGIEHPVHALPHDRRMQSIERHVRVPPRPEAIGELKEVGLIDGAQHLSDRTLDDLVLQRWHTERPLTPSALGM